MVNIKPAKHQPVNIVIFERDIKPLLQLYSTISYKHIIISNNTHMRKSSSALREQNLHLGLSLMLSCIILHSGLSCLV